VSSLEKISEAVLEKKLKMCEPIRGEGGHIGFWSSDPLGQSGPHKEHVHQVWNRSQ